MRFALLGNHPDGVDLATALLASGRYQMAAWTAAVPAGLVQMAGAEARQLLDLEEVLADPQVELVIVAGIEPNRPAQLRRALHAERHVVAVHPPDRTPEIAYEAGMIAKDTGRLVLPLLTEALHPAVQRLKDQFGPVGPLGTLVLLEMTRQPAAVPPSADPAAERKPNLPGWDVLRALGGEIAEVSAFARGEEAWAGEPMLVSGRFERGGLFQLVLKPSDDESCRIVAQGSGGRADLFFPQGWRGPGFLTLPQGDDRQEEAWESWDPWTAVVDQVDAALADLSTAKTPAKAAATESKVNHLSWEDEIRCLELDEAARRSVERRRSSLLEYQEASETVGFKGTMTLLGCGLLWVMLALLLVMAIVGGLKSSKAGLESMLPEGFGATPCIGVLFGVPLLLFLLLQLLRMLTRDNPRKQKAESQGTQPADYRVSDAPKRTSGHSP